MSTITSFGYWVRRQRKALDLTQSALAKQVGCAVVTVRKIERDERRPSLEMAGLLAQHLAITATERQDFLDMARGLYVTEVEASTMLVEASTTDSPIQIAHNLSPQPTPFIGRKGGLTALDELLKNPDIRLMTIVGLGGMGKTRLALASAERFIGTRDNPLFPNGVYFVSLAPLSDPDHIVTAMAEAFDFPLESDGQQKRSAKQQILDYLKEKRMLVVLDNFEHLLEGAELVSELLQMAPRLQILATSRERLHLQEEQIFAIHGLEFPDWETASSSGESEDAIEYTAVKLFLQAAKRINREFALQTTDMTFLSRICRLVGGMPLAVELAAGWVDMLSLEEIAAEIQQNLDFLETDVRNVPERHRNMRAVFDASWQRMSQAEQAIFAQLSIFRGGFTRQAGQAITDATLRLLSTLVNKSLIQFSQADGRYQIHELLRQYGEEKLNGRGQMADEVRNWHSRYYCQALKKCAADLKGARQKVTLAEIESDIENVRVAWRRAAQNQKTKSLTGAMDSLGYFHEWRGRYQEGETLFGAAAEALTATETAVALRTRARLLAWQSVFTNIVQEGNWAVELCQQGMALLQHEALEASDTRQEEAFILHQLGRARHDFGRRKEVLEKSLSLWREIGDAWGLANVLQILGNPTSWSGGLNDCAAYLEECLSIRRALGDRRGTAQTLAAQSELLRFKGEVKESLPLAEEALQISEAIGSRSISVRGFIDRGWSLLHLAKFDEAVTAFNKSLHLSQNFGDRWNVCLGRFGLYQVELARGKLGEAIKQAEMIVKLSLPSWLWELGEIPLIQKRYDEAIALIQKQLPKALATQQLMQTVSSFSYFSMAEHGRRRLEHAHYYAYQGLEMAVRAQHFMIMQQNFPCLINLLAEDGNVERAVQFDALNRSRHPLLDQSWGWEMLRRPFAERIAALPEEVVAVARERGRQLDYWQTVIRLREELKEKGWDQVPSA